MFTTMYNSLSRRGRPHQRPLSRTRAFLWMLPLLCFLFVGNTAMADHVTITGSSPTENGSDWTPNNGISPWAYQWSFATNFGNSTLSIHNFGSSSTLTNMVIDSLHVFLRYNQSNTNNGRTAYLNSVSLGALIPSPANNTMIGSGHTWGTSDILGMFSFINPPSGTGHIDYTDISSLQLLAGVTTTRGNFSFNPTSTTATIFFDSITVYYHGTSIPTGPSLALGGDAANGPLVLSNEYGSPSAASSLFTITWSELTSNVIYTVPAGYEISEDGSTGWTSTVSTLSASSGSHNFYVRADGTADVGTSVLDSIVFTSNNASSVKVLLNRTTTPKPLTLDWPHALISKTYDGDDSVPKEFYPTLNGVISPDVVSLDVTSAAYPSVNAGDYTGTNGVSFTGLSLSGADAGNYSIVSSAMHDGEIIKADLTVDATGYSGTKVYDGNTTEGATTYTGSISFSGATPDGALTFIPSSPYTYTYTYNDAHVLTADSITLAVGYGLQNVSAENVTDNYNLVPVKFKGTITPFPLNLGSGTLAASKTYDGDATIPVIDSVTGSAELTSGNVSSIPDGSNVSVPITIGSGPSVNGTFTFDSKDAGSRTVTWKGYVLDTISGARGSDYALSPDSSVGITFNGTIHQQSITITPHDTTKCYNVGYNTRWHAGDFDVTGLVTGESIDSIDIATGTTTNRLGANTIDGIYDLIPSNAIVASGNSTNLGNYDITYATKTGGLTVLEQVSADFNSATNVTICSGNSATVTGNFHAPTGTQLTVDVVVARQNGNSLDTIGRERFTNINTDPAKALVIDDTLLPNTGSENVTYVLSFDSLTTDNPDYNNCAGTTTGSVLVTVNPAPIFTLNADLAACSGDQTAVVTINHNNNVAGANYKITADYNGVTGGIVPVAGLNRTFTDSILNESLVNSTNAPIVVTYAVSGKSPLNCQGSIDTVKVTVNPRPHETFTFTGGAYTAAPIANDSTYTVCASAPVHLAMSSATDGNTHYHLVNTTTNQVVGDGTFPAAGSNTFDFVASATNAGVYTLTLTNNNSQCDTTITFTLSVNPLPSDVLTFNGTAITSGSTQNVCEGSAFTIGSTDDADVSIVVTRDQDTVVNANAIASTVYTVASAADADANIYHVTLTNNATGCDTTFDFTIKVNQQPEFTFTMNNNPLTVDGHDSICEGSEADLTLKVTNATAAVVDTLILMTPNYGNDTLAVGGTGNSQLPAVGQDGTLTVTHPSFHAGLNDAGDYTIRLITDAGCSYDYNYHLTVNPKPVFTFTMNGSDLSQTTANEICQGSDVNLALTVSNVDLDSLVFMTPNHGNDTLTNIIAATTVPDQFTAGLSDSGEYHVRMVTAAGCSYEYTYVLQVNHLPVETISLNGTALNNGDHRTVFAGSPVDITVVNPTGADHFVMVRTNASGTDTVGNATVGSLAGGNTYSFNANYTDSGSYHLVFKTPSGCTTEYDYYLNVIPDTLYVVVDPNSTPNITKVYDGSDSVVKSTLPGFLLSHSSTSLVAVPSYAADVHLNDTTNTVFTYAQTDTGSHIAVHGEGFTISGADADKYYFVDGVDTIGKITPRPITITAVDTEKCYNDVFATGTTFDASYFTVGNIVDGQSIESVVLTVNPTANAAAHAANPATPNTAITGTLTPSGAVAGTGTNLNNYTITYAPGTLTSQPRLRANVISAANNAVCNGAGVSINYSLEGAGMLTGALRVSRVYGTTSVVPLDTIYLAPQSAGSFSTVLDPSETPNDGSSDHITYRFDFIGVSSNVSHCDGEVGGQVDVSVYPVPVLDVANAADTICSDGTVTLTMTDANNTVGGATYRVQANYPAGITGGTANGSNYSFTSPTFTETLHNNTNQPLTVTYTIDAKNGSSVQSCQTLPITTTVVVNPTPTVDSFGIAPVCDGDNLIGVFTGLIPNKTFSADLKLSLGPVSIDTMVTLTADNAGGATYSLPSTMELNNVTVTINSLTSTETGCVLDLSNSTAPLAATITVHPLPTNDSVAFNGTNVVNHADIDVCAQSPVAITTSGNATDTFRLYRADGTTLVVPADQVGDSTYTFTAQLSDAGDYYMTWTTQFGCTVTDTFHLNVNGLPSGNLVVVNAIANNNNDTFTTCEGTPIQVTTASVSDADSFAMYRADGSLLAAGLDADSTFSFNARLTDNGTYTLNWYSAKGCTTTDSFTLVVNPLPQDTLYFGGQAVANGDTQEVCEQSTVAITTSGAAADGFTLYRADNTTVVVPTGTIGADSTYTFVAQLSDAGTYYMHWTTVNGCEVVDTFNLVVHPLPSFVVTGITNVNCNGNNDGGFDFTLTNNSDVLGSFTMNIVDATTGNTVYSVAPQSVPAHSTVTGHQGNLVAGNYTVNVTNQYGCVTTVSNQLNITQPSALVLDVDSVDVLCGGTFGKINVVPGGGVSASGSYTIHLSGNGVNNTNYTAQANTTYQITNLLPGNYTVSMADDHGCSITGSTTIHLPSSAVVASVSAPAVVAVNAHDSVTFSTVGGAFPVTYNYTVNGTSATVTSSATSGVVKVAIPTSAPATYTYDLVSVTDANGTPCSPTINPNEAVVDVQNILNVDLGPVVQAQSGALSIANPVPGQSTSGDITLFNIGNDNSVGVISFGVLKPSAGIDLDFSAATGWTATLLNNTVYVLQSDGTVVVPHGSTISVPFTATLNSGAQIGSFIMSVILDNGTGGDNAAGNNNTNFGFNVGN